MSSGWIKLYRKSIDSRVFNNEGLWKVWTWCLMKANHKEQWISIKTGKGTNEVLIKPGQFIFGRKTAAKELKMAESSVRNRIEKLKNMRNLDVKTDTHCSIISLINWDSYQAEEIKEDTQKDRQRTGKGQAKDTNKNDNNEKNDKNIYTPDFELIWKQYPNKDGKSDSLRHFKASVKTEEDFNNITTALNNYLTHLKQNTWKKPKNGSTWFNNWTDWIEWVEPIIEESKDYEVIIDGESQFLTESEFKQWKVKHGR